MRAVYQNLLEDLLIVSRKRGGLVLHRTIACACKKEIGFEVTYTTAFGTSDRAEMERIAKERVWVPFTF